MICQDDVISLHGLGLAAHLGVPDGERAIPQRVEADITLYPRRPLTALGDEVGRTVNYSEVATVCRATAAGAPRRLLETLAEDLCGALLRRWPLAAVRVTIRKRIVPDAEAVSVTLHRRAGEPASSPAL